MTNVASGSSGDDRSVPIPEKPGFELHEFLTNFP